MKAQTTARYILVSHFFWRPEVRLRSLGRKVQFRRVVPREHRIGTQWCRRKRNGRRTVWSSSCLDGTTLRSRGTSIPPLFSQTLTRSHGGTAHPSGSVAFNGFFLETLAQTRGRLTDLASTKRLPLQSGQLHLAWSMVLVATARSLHGGCSAQSATSGIFNVHSEDIDTLPRASERARRGCGLWSPIRSPVGSGGIFPAITVVRLSMITRHLEGGASEDLPLASLSSSLSSHSFPLSRPRERRRAACSPVPDVSRNLDRFVRPRSASRLRLDH